MHGLAVYVKEGLPFAWDLSLENSADSYLSFWLALLHSVSLCTVFDSVSSNIDEILSINPSANVFAFGDFNILHKDWLTFSGGTDRSGELCYNFSISKDLTQMVNFLTWILGCDSHSAALLDLFLLTLVFVLQWLYFHWEILITLLSQFPLTSQISQQDVLSHLIAFEYSRADWDDLCDHLKDVPWEDIFKLSASVGTSESCEWV